MSETLDSLGGYRGLNIVHLNIRSLWNKIDIFKSTFNNSNVQILGLSETWLTSAIPNSLVDLPGYTLLRNDRNFGNGGSTQVRKGGGVCLYIQDNINAVVTEIDNMNSCLDHVYTNSNIIKSSGTPDVNINDHLPVYINRKKKKNVLLDKVKFLGRSYRNYDTDIFANDLARQEWDRFDNTMDPNILWEIFCKNIVNILDVTCPMKSFSIKQYKEPWITNELLELIKDKDHALR